MYKVGEALPPGLAEEVEPGQSLLVSGPAMTGKRELVFDLLARGAPDGEGAVIITTRESGDGLAYSYREQLDGQEQDVWIVDCMSAGAASDDASVPVPIEYVSSPGDLTGIGIAFSNVASDAEQAGVERLRIGFDSLSPLLMYADLQRVFRFLHAFTRQIQNRGSLGLFIVEADSHDEQEFNTIRQLFDGLLEMRMGEDGRREARLRGVGDAPTDWVPLE